jgi:hypothetical protein
MTPREAFRKGIRRIRDPKWACERDYLLIDIFEINGERYRGPWVHLYSPHQPACGQPTPQDLLFDRIDWDEGGIEEYTGELWATETT